MSNPRMVNVDRATPMLLPPDLREWVGDDDMVHLVIESVDGTHIAANASKDRNVRYDRAGELEAQLKLDIAELMKQAEQEDQSEREDGQSLPEQIDRRQKLLAKMQEARAQLEAQAKARAEAERGKRNTDGEQYC